MTRFTRAHPRTVAFACAAALPVVLLCPFKARAATASSTFNVSANVLAVCTVTATDLSFGDYDASHPSARDATSTLSVTCSKGQGYTIALGAGSGAGATVADRKMTSGANTLNYGLYSNASHTTVWGDGTLSSVTVSGTGDGQAQSLTVQGEIPPGQHVAAGTYSDTITVTLDY
jgi:spore coat protein U domain-containing protein, fimbrial subunit CupE1/2/3/6